ncbi:MAG: DNA methyltransferase, partial [Acetivibrio ethanolgignens]
MANTNTYKGIYAMHKYWGKKPFNEISKFIEKYTLPGETVLDSFCGSGVTLIEALKANRMCVGVDLNPLAIKLTKVSMTAVDIDEVNRQFKDITKKLKSTINSLYELEYEDEQTLVTHTIWKNDVPIEVWYSTNRSKKKIRKGTDADITMSQYPSIEPKWYPNTLMFENSRINVGHNQTVDDLFTPRALVGLSLLCDEIKNIKDPDIRNIFELTLTGTLSQASNLVFVIRGRKKNEGASPKAEVGSWVIGYWVPEEHFEINVWNCFENRFKRIAKGINEINELFSNRENGYYENNVRLINGSATHLQLENNSVDYVFIDPPHANRILYLEQSL